MICSVCFASTQGKPEDRIIWKWGALHLRMHFLEGFRLNQHNLGQPSVHLPLFPSLVCGLSTLVWSLDTLDSEFEQ